jgi:hypothetical protein
MTTVSITLENNTMVSALQSVLLQLKGVQNVMVWEDDAPISNKKTMEAMQELLQVK